MTDYKVEVNIASASVWSALTLSWTHSSFPHWKSQQSSNLQGDGWPWAPGTSRATSITAAPELILDNLNFFSQRGAYSYWCGRLTIVPGEAERQRATSAAEQSICPCTLKIVGITYFSTHECGVYTSSRLWHGTGYGDICRSRLPVEVADDLWIFASPQIKLTFRTQLSTCRL